MSSDFVVGQAIFAKLVHSSNDSPTQNSANLQIRARLMIHSSAMKT
ncbi:MAG: hypothetical protein R3D05_03735 [Dongiaceae bacterium]